MKVLHVMNELKPSGAEVMLEKATLFWSSLGCELHVLAIADSPGSFAKQLEIAGWQVSHLNSSQGILSLMRSLYVCICKIQPDLVHFHQERLSLPLGFAVSLAGVPILRTVHNNFPFEGILRLRKSFERYLSRSMGCQFISISDSVLKNEKKRFNNPTKLCWNWFDSNKFRPPTYEEKIQTRQKLGIPQNQIVLVSVGNGSDTKNYQLIVQCLAQLGHPSLHYYQIGNPHPNNTDQNLASDLKIQNQTSFIGPQSHVIDWLWASDIFIMPSLFEGFAISALEALACGCQCIFADSPGLSDLRNFSFNASWTKTKVENFCIEIRKMLDSSLDIISLNDNSINCRKLFDVNVRSNEYYNIWHAVTTNKFQVM